jgi:4-hydroxybenzoate polyprenyltransferase
MRHYFSLIKFSHTIFAMPFALLGLFLAVNLQGKSFDLQIFVLIVLCMVFARSAAMAFNRYLDREIDLRNPRTKIREIPSGIISPLAALTFTVLSALAFVITTLFINRLCFSLSPIALLIILGYSYTKRFTYLCHFVLGLGLSLAPIGAYLAAGGGFDLLPILFSIIVLLWVSGFDIIYSLQDEDFDKSMSLLSIPVKFGKSGALTFARLLHGLAGSLLVIAVVLAGTLYPELGWLSWLAVIIFEGLLIYQHKLVSPGDLSKVNLAFFTTNGIASLVFSLMFIIDLIN